MLACCRALNSVVRFSGAPAPTFVTLSLRSQLAAGAYAVAHEDVSATLPGVAVAVALVPPLAATGILIGAREGVLAEGSAPPYATNLFAIAFSALATLLITGVIPTARFFFRDSRMAAVVIGIFIATVAIAIPLTSRRSTLRRHHVNKATSSPKSNWLGNKDLEVTTLDVIGTAVTVELTGLDEPPEAYALATRLVPALGADAEVTVRWDARAQGSASAEHHLPPTPQKWQQPCSTTGSSVSPMKASCWNCSRSPSQKGRSIVVSGQRSSSSPELANNVADASVTVRLTSDGFSRLTRRSLMSRQSIALIVSSTPGWSAKQCSGSLYRRQRLVIERMECAR